MAGNQRDCKRGEHRKQMGAVAVIRNRRLNVGKGMDNAPSDEGDVGGNIQREPHSAMPNQDR